MACKVQYSNGKPAVVFADRINPKTKLPFKSKLFNDLLKIYKDPDIAYTKYLTIYTPEFIDTLPVDAQKLILKDVNNPNYNTIFKNKEKLEKGGLFDRSGEPHHSLITKFHNETPDGFQSAETHPHEFTNALYNFLKRLNVNVNFDYDQMLTKMEHYLNQEEYENAEREGRPVNESKLRTVLAVTDIINKFIGLKNDPTGRFTDLPKEAALVIFEMLGRKNKLQHDLWRNIGDFVNGQPVVKKDAEGRVFWHRYPEVYNKYRNQRVRPIEAEDIDILTSNQRDNRFDVYAHKMAIVELIADGLRANFGKDIITKKKRLSEDVNAEYFAKRGYPSLDLYNKEKEAKKKQLTEMYKKQGLTGRELSDKVNLEYNKYVYETTDAFRETPFGGSKWFVKKWRQLIKAILDAINRAFPTVSQAEFQDLVKDIVDDVFSLNMEKFHRGIEYLPEYDGGKGALLKPDGTILELKTIDETFWDTSDPSIRKAKDIIDFVTSPAGLGGVLSGSIVYRKAGTLYRKEGETFHDLDFAIPYEVMAGEELKSAVESKIQEGLRMRPSILNEPFSNNTKRWEKELWGIMKNLRFIKAFKAKYPGAKLAALFVGKEHKKGESITMAFRLPDGTTVDFFVRMQIPSEFGVKFPEATVDATGQLTPKGKYKSILQIFGAKIRMGRFKDIMDLIFYDRYPDFVDKLPGIKKESKGYRHISILTQERGEENFYQMSPQYKEDLEQELDVAVKDENFEEAARLRDRISKIDPTSIEGRNFLSKPSSGVQPLGYIEGYFQTPQEINKNRVNSKMMILFDQMGVDIKLVQQILDRKGKPVDAVAVAKITQKIVEVIADKANPTTLPEEAAHFFVALLKSTKNPLYASMMNNITNYDIYKQIIQDPRYIEQYGNHPDADVLFREEAIGQVIVKHIFNQEMGTELPARTRRVESWWDKIVNFVKKLFSGILTDHPNFDPYAKAAFDMLNSEIDKAAMPTLAGPDLYQLEVTDEESKQDRIIKEVLNLNQKLTLKDLEKDDIRIEQDVKEVLVDAVGKKGIQQLVLTEEDGTEHVIKNSPNNKNLKDLIRKRGLDKAKEIAESDRAKHRRKNNIRVHDTGQRLLGWFASSKISPNLEVVNQSETSKSLVYIKRASGMSEPVFEQLKNGIKHVMAQINMLENEISNGEGKTKIIIMPKTYNEGNDEGAYVDMMAVHSNGQISLFNFGTMTPNSSQVIGRGKDRHLRADSNPHEYMLSRWNAPVALFKSILMNIHGLEESDIRQTRIIPIWLQYKGEKIDGNYVIKDTISFLRMDTPKDILVNKLRKAIKKLRRKQEIQGYLNKKDSALLSKFNKELTKIETEHGKKTSFLQQISVAKELTYTHSGTAYAGLNRLLKKLYDRRAEIQQNLEYRKRKVDRAKLKSELTKIEQQIQRLTVSKKLSEVIWETNKSIAKLLSRKDIPNTQDGYLDITELMDIKEDLMLYESMNKDTVEYLSDQLKSKDPAIKKAAELQKSLIEKGSYTIAQYLTLVNKLLDQRLEERATEQGEDITVPSVERGRTHKNFLYMGDIDNPVFRVAYNEIFNKKLARVENKIRKQNEILAKHKTAIELWAKENNMTLDQALETLWVKKINSKGEYYDKGLAPILERELYDLIKDKIKNKDYTWLQKYLKYKSDAKERYQKDLAQFTAIVEQESSDVLQYNPATKKMEIVEDKSKIRKARIAAWKKDNDIFSKTPHGTFLYPEAWLKTNWSNLLEANIEALQKDNYPTYTKEYQFLMQKGNEPLLNFYNHHKEVVQLIRDETGYQLSPTFMANVTNSTSEIFLNHGFFNKTAWKKIWDNISRAFLAKDEEQTWGIFDDNGDLVNQVPFLFVNELRNTEGNRDGSLKSTEMFKNLSLLVGAAYSYKFGLEVLSFTDAMRDYLSRHDLEVSTTPGGKIIRDEFDNIRTRPVSEDTLGLFDRFIKAHIFGQKVQSKDMRWGNLSLNKTISALKSFDSLRKLGWAIIPGIAARTVGGINMFIEGIDGLYWNNKQHKQAVYANAKREKWVFGLAEFFNPYQQNISFEEQLKLSVNKLNKYFDLSRAFAFLREPDENMDMVGLAAMSMNYGIKDGMPVKLEQLPEGSKSIADLMKEQVKKGEVGIPGLSEAGYNQFRRMIKTVMTEIKGNMSDENILAVNTELIGGTLMHYKSWMPGVATARFGSLRYDHLMKTLKEGRYIGFLKGAGGDFLQDVENERKLAGFFHSVAKRGKEAVMEFIGLKKIQLTSIERQDKITKGEKEGNKWKYWTKKDEARWKEARKALEIEMKEWKRQNTDPAIQKITLEEFVQLRQRSMKRTLAEVRIYMLLGMLVSGMGMSDADDEKYYNQNVFLRKMYQVFNRTRLELGFALNPNELGVMLRGGIPLVGLFTDLLALIDSGWDDTLGGLGLITESPYDHPTWYHILKFTPGGNQLNRVFEFNSDSVMY